MALKNGSFLGRKGAKPRNGTPLGPVELRKKFIDKNRLSENNFIRLILFSSLETAIDFTWRKVGGSQRKLDEKSNQQYVNQNQPNCHFEMCYYTDGKKQVGSVFYTFAGLRELLRPTERRKRKMHRHDSRCLT
jgi:hypothetical protein